MKICDYCGAQIAGRTLSAREMMFGRRTPFDYRLCSGCGSCFLVTPLSEFDLGSYYGGNYYSFRRNADGKTALKAALLKRRGRYEMGARDMVGAALHAIKPGDASFLLQYGVTLRSRVLDVGCGSGEWLRHAAQYGLRDLRGCDPYLAEPIDTPDVKVEKRCIEDMRGRFDFIFFHHSFEHLVDPKGSLAAARRLQHASDTCVIRAPTTSSVAFDEYGANWVQLDPPRHLSIPSRDGMRHLAAACGYAVERMIDDSGSFQFWASEQYVADIPLESERSWRENPSLSIFTRDQIKGYEARARDLNACNRGDQTAFVLRAV